MLGRMDDRRDNNYVALVNSHRAVAESDRVLRLAFETLNAIDVMLSTSRTAIETTRQRLAQPSRAERLWS